jgi:DNA-binding transcriptional MerR regulator
LLTQQVARGTGGHRRYDPQEVHWLRVCIKLRKSGMPPAEIRRLADLVREGPGNEPERLELLREQQRRVENQLAELEECLRVITRKVGVYEHTLPTVRPRTSGRPRPEAPRAGFEPAAYSLGGSRSIRLSYRGQLSSKPHFQS